MLCFTHSCTFFGLGFHMSDSTKLPGQLDNLLEHVPLPSDGSVATSPPSEPIARRGRRSVQSSALSIDILSDTVNTIRDSLSLKDSYREELCQLDFVEKDLEQLFRNGLPYVRYSQLCSDIKFVRDLIRGELSRFRGKRKFKSHAEVAEHWGVDPSFSHTFKLLSERLEPEVLGDIDLHTMMDSKGNSYSFFLNDNKELDLRISNPFEETQSQYLAMQARISGDMLNERILEQILKLKDGL